jgi:NAD(P)-dependent dehydrogenase (short-subunit alcohol dehydrogenase family)
MHSSSTGTAWITGGGSGIGQALPLKLAKADWKVAVSGRRPEALHETVRQAAGNVHAYPLDVSDLQAMRNAAASIESDLGAIDLVVLNAGFGRFVKLDNLRAENFAAHMQVNYLGVVNGIDAVLAGFRQRRCGHIVIVASVAGYRGLPRTAAYGPTKAALINLAESLRFDLEREGISISVCNPGFVDTPMTAGNRVPMPFLMNLQDATDALYRGIMRQKFEIIFPLRFVLLLKLLRCLPYVLYFPVMRKFTGH